MALAWPRSGGPAQPQLCAAPRRSGSRSGCSRSSARLSPPGAAASAPCRRRPIPLASGHRPLAAPLGSPPAGPARAKPTRQRPPCAPRPGAARECSEQSPITWVLGVPEPSKFGSKIFWSGENSYCLQHTQRNTYGFMSVPKKCKNCPALPSSSLPTVLGRYGAPPWKSVIPSSCLASASY